MVVDEPVVGGWVSGWCDVHGLCTAIPSNCVSPPGVLLMLSRVRAADSSPAVLCCVCTCVSVYVSAAASRFATRISNVFVIGRGNKPLVTLPKGKGVRPTILQEQTKRFGSA